VPIERRVETEAETPDYSGRKFTPEQIAAGMHRKFIGGHWETHGQHQLDFLRAQGLQPKHKFLDVGCGSLRAGRLLTEYLDPGNYYGIDANIELLEVGYEQELTDAQRARLPITNLRMNDRFDGDFGVKFDMAIAQSVFSHVSLNHVRLCLFRVASVMAPGGKFYTTFFEQPRKTPIDTIIAKPNRKPRMTERNLFWYYASDLEWASSFAPWQYRYIGEWGHPVGQHIVEFTRLADDSRAPAAPSSRLQAVTKRGRNWAARKLATR
jgi:SAM-dependent methyltransferase